MPAAEIRYCVAEVTEESLAGWDRFVDRHDLDRTALCEILGLRLGRLTGPLPAPLERWVEDAKTLRRQRRRRS